MRDNGTPQGTTQINKEVQSLCQQELLELLESISDPYCALNEQWQFTYLNQAAEKSWHRPREALLGRVIWEEFPNSVGTAAYHALQQAARDRQKAHLETFATFTDGWLEVNISPTAHGISIHFHDITARIHTEEQLRQLSTRDSLTGLYNRAYFEEKVSQLDRNGPFPVSVIIADIDGMKRVNDTQGHAAGDDLLRRAAAILTAALGRDGVAARIGGDEFALLLPQVGAQAGKRMLQQIRSSVPEHNAAYDSSPLRLSLGLAVADGPSRVAEALKQADWRMYQDKQRRSPLQDLDPSRHLAALVTASGEAIVGITTDRRIASWNAGAERLYGYAAAEAVGRSVDLLYPPGMAEQMAAIIEQVIRGEAVQRLETVRLRKDGCPVHVSLSLSPVKDGHGQVIGISGVAHDLTAAQQAADTLRRYQLLSEHAHDIVLFVRADDGRILEANRAAEMAYGYTRDELLSQTIQDLRDPSTHTAVQAQMGQANAAGIRFETLHRRKDGSTFPVDVSSVGADMGSERVLLSIIRDITERKRAEQALRESEDRLRLYIDDANDLIFTLDPSAHFRAVNKAVCALTGYSPAELIGRNALDFITPGARTSAASILSAMQQGEAEVVDQVELDIITKTGDVRTIEVRGRRICRDGRLVELLEIARDITERKRAEEQVRLQASMLDQVHNAVVATALDGRITYWNRFAEVLYQWSAQEVLGRNINDVVVPEEHERVGAAILAGIANAGHWDGELTVMRKDGARFPAHVVGTLLRDGQGEPVGIVGVGIDISPLKQAQEARG